MNTIIEYVRDNGSMLLVVAALVAMVLWFHRYRRPQASVSRKLSYAERAGAAGEAYVVGMLRRGGFELVHDLVFARPNGKTKQIDIIVRLRNGRLVILEVKRYAGKVKGADGQEQWLHIRKDGSTKSVLNPLFQGDWQAQAVRERTGYQPYVVAVNAGTAIFESKQVIPLRDLKVKLESLASSGRESTDAAWRTIQKWRACDNEKLNQQHYARMKLEHG